MQRQKIITLRKGDPTAQVRMEACSQEIIMQYFDQLKEVLEEHDLMDNFITLMKLACCLTTVLQMSWQKKGKRKYGTGHPVT